MLVLASASPRRQELLRWLAVPFVVESADVDERVAPGESAAALVARLARAKAAAVAKRRSADWVLGADTIVELDGRLLGKPADEDEAADMLATLGGREHRVLTGVALLAPGGTLHTQELVESRVCFRRLTAAAIAAYIATGESADKAGAYAAQGQGTALIEAIDGSFTNVIGLPLSHVERALRGAGLLA
jgi:septum formation protein